MRFDFDQTLDALRAAAQARDPEQTQFLLKRIFLAMPFYRALAVAIEQTYRHLEIFERYHPEARWARQSLVQIASLGTAPGKLPDEAMEPTFTTPGTANFIKALFDLAHASRQSNLLEARVGYLVSAVVNAIMAELVALWYEPRLADWERVRQNSYDPATGQYSDPEATQIAYHFWTDAQVTQRDIDAWLEVTDNITKKLERQW